MSNSGSLLLFSCLGFTPSLPPTLSAIRRHSNLFCHRVHANYGQSWINQGWTNRSHFIAGLLTTIP